MVNMTDLGNDEHAKPEGADFKITLIGRDIWFRKMLDSQHITISRIQRRTQKDIQAIFAKPIAPEDAKAAEQEISSLIDGMYQRMWDAIDSTIILEADREFLLDAMLTAKLQMSDAMRVFRQGKDEPQPDDAEVVAKPRPVRAPRKAAAAKKAVGAKKAVPAKKTVANAKRTQR
jgi:hypothetical protein